MVLIFVYGTLKAGQPNHYLMVGSDGKLICEYRGRAQTADRYPLVVATTNNVPFMLYVQGDGQHVTGELYEVMDEDHLQMLDSLEGHPVLYERQNLKVRVLDGDKSGTIMDVQSYFLVKYRSFMRDMTTLSEYTDGVNGKYYVLPPKPDPSVPVQDSLPLWTNQIHTEYD